MSQISGEFPHGFSASGHVASRGAMEGARESHARGGRMVESIESQETCRLTKAISDHICVTVKHR
jgi:hypothetical protein